MYDLRRGRQNAGLMLGDGGKYRSSTERGAEYMADVRRRGQNTYLMSGEREDCKSDAKILGYKQVKF